MKTKRFVSLVSAFVASASLVGCARDAGKTRILHSTATLMGSTGMLILKTR